MRCGKLDDSELSAFFTPKAGRRACLLYLCGRLSKPEKLAERVSFEKNKIVCEKTDSSIVFLVRGYKQKRFLDILREEAMSERKEKRLQAAIQAYTPLLLYIAYSYLKNRMEAEDAVQEVFLTYYQKAPPFQTTEHEKAWLLKVTANRCKNMLKSSWFRRVLLGEEIWASQEEPDSEVMDAILRLPIKYREVICLHYVEGYSIQETAKLLHRTPTAVGTQLQRARKKLKMDLEGSL